MMVLILERELRSVFFVYPAVFVPNTDETMSRNIQQRQVSCILLQVVLQHRHSALPVMCPSQLLVSFYKRQYCS